MAALARLQASDCDNPALDVFTSVGGLLVDVAVLKFQIWDKTTGTPVQVYPDSIGGKEDVNLDDCDDGGDRLSLGRYVADYTPPVDANLGTYQVRWYIQFDVSSSAQVFIEEFEVLADVTASSGSPEGYLLVSDMRDEGVPATFTDDWLIKRIALASRFVEASTRRFFYPKAMTFRVDGRGGPKLLLSDPIIAIETVKFEISPLYPENFQVVETDIMRVYNRHLSAGLTEPDDRNNPKIELFNPGFVRDRQTPMLTRLNFPVGQLNVEVTGVFGYTDPDGTNTQGKTPDLIKHVTKLIVFKELAKMQKATSRFDARARFRLTSERTRDQAYTLEGLGSLRGAGFTGDPEIDNVLAYFSRPPAMGAV